MFVLTQRLQNDPIGRRFSQYRQTSGGRFLVSLLEVRNKERILACSSSLKADVDLWQEDLGTEIEAIENFMSILEKHETDIYEVCLSDSSEEVARVIARYIVRKLQAKLKCENCALLKVDGSEEASERDRYLNLLSRCGLIKPSEPMAEFVINSFALFDSSSLHQ